jgi:VWFA-related protein
MPPASAAQTPGPSPTAAQQPTFRASADAVRVDVSVRRNGRPQSGLTAGDFEITDNGVVQQITDLSFETAAIDVTVALDLSRSVAGLALERLRRGIDQLGNRLRAGDRLKLVTFNMRIRRLVDFSDPRGASDAALEGAAAGGGTSLLDALVVLLSSPAPLDRRQLIIVFSDGSDTTSVTEPADVMGVAARTSATVTFVQPGSEAVLRTAPTADRAGPAPQPGASAYPSSVVLNQAPGQAPAIYRALAVETGGQILQSGYQNLSGAFTQLLDQFRSSYVLHYTPSGVSSTGFHTLAVKVKRDGTFDVRARRGYASD